MFASGEHRKNSRLRLGQVTSFHQSICGILYLVFPTRSQISINTNYLKGDSTRRLCFSCVLFLPKSHGCINVIHGCEKTHHVLSPCGRHQTEHSLKLFAPVGPRVLTFSVWGHFTPTTYWPPYRAMTFMAAALISSKGAAFERWWIWSADSFNSFATLAQSTPTSLPFCLTI